jgi:hypothetical protein
VSVIWKVGAVVLALLLIAGAVRAITGGGESGSNTNATKVLTMGDTKITIPGNTMREELIPVLLNKYLAKAGYVVSYRQCVAREVGKAIPPNELQKVENLSPTALKKSGHDLIEEAGPKCRKSGEAILDPHATPAQIAITRKSMVAAIPVELAALNLTPAQTACAAKRVGKISDAEVLFVINSSASRGEAIYRKAMKPCLH